MRQRGRLKYRKRNLESFQWQDTEVASVWLTQKGRFLNRLGIAGLLVLELAMSRQTRLLYVSIHGPMHHENRREGLDHGKTYIDWRDVHCRASLINGNFPRCHWRNDTMGPSRLTEMRNAGRRIDTRVLLIFRMINRETSTFPGRH